MSSYNDYQAMNDWGMGSYKQPQQVPMFNGGQSYAPSSVFSGSGWAPSTDFSFGKRPDALSAGVPSMSDYFTGAKQSFGEGNIMAGLKDLGAGAVDSLGGKDFWMGGTDEATGMKTMGAAGVGIDLFKALSGYMGARSTAKLGRAALDQNKLQFGANFNNAATMADDTREGRYLRDVAEAKLNNKQMPKEFKPLARV